MSLLTIHDPSLFYESSMSDTRPSCVRGLPPSYRCVSFSEVPSGYRSAIPGGPLRGGPSSSMSDLSYPGSPFYRPKFRVKVKKDQSTGTWTESPGGKGVDILRTLLELRWTEEDLEDPLRVLTYNHFRGSLVLLNMYT